MSLQSNSVKPTEIPLSEIQTPPSACVGSSKDRRNGGHNEGHSHR